MITSKRFLCEVRARLVKIERLIGDWAKGRKLYGHLYDDLLKLKYLHQRYTNYLRWLKTQISKVTKGEGIATGKKLTTTLPQYLARDHPPCRQYLSDQIHGEVSQGEKGQRLTKS